MPLEGFERSRLLKRDRRRRPLWDELRLAAIRIGRADGDLGRAGRGETRPLARECCENNQQHEHQTASIARGHWG